MKTPKTLKSTKPKLIRDTLIYGTLSALALATTLTTNPAGLLVTSISNPHKKNLIHAVPKTDSLEEISEMAKHILDTPNIGENKEIQQDLDGIQWLQDQVRLEVNEQENILIAEMQKDSQKTLASR